MLHPHKIARVTPGYAGITVADWHVITFGKKLIYHEQQPTEPKSG